MQLSSVHVRQNPLILVSILMSVIGWFIMFVGACVIGRAGLLWWIVIYELLLVGGILFSIFRQSFHHYQTSFLIFLGVSLSLLTTTINGLLTYSSNGSQASGAGAVIMIVMQFFWVVLFSCSEESVVYQFIYSDFIVPAVQPNNMADTTKESKHHYASPEPQYASPIVPQQPPISMAAHPSPAASVSASFATALSPTPPVIVTAVALHPYTANPEDPNEISFVRDETLEILNRSGNWWQARKSDGTVGIVPSNYFAPF
ncbi:hypothetical protein EDC96DRAFT_472810 [Choanephora cucurbitarum]|nr:hypothetical protein EDC96DRAFT_472810 [Choanephora cucurbitarum]